MKICTQCKEEKSLDPFYISKKGKVKAGCKKCNTIRSVNYVKKNPEKKKISLAIWREKNLDEILKKDRIRSKIRYDKDPIPFRKYSKDNQKRRKDWFLELRKTFSCERCSFSDYRALQFHHKDPSDKIMGVTKMLYNGWPKEKILNELQKCSCLCANCHFIEHFEQRKNNKINTAV